MSNAVLNAHLMLGEPCGEGAELSEIADWAGELIMSGNGGLTKQQVLWLKSIGEFLHTEHSEPGQREWALEEYYRLWDSVSGSEG
jgi:hypothetical protein